GGPGVEHGGDVTPVGARGQPDGLDPRVLGRDALCGGGSVHVRHHDVHHGDRGGGLRDHPGGFVTVPRLTHNPHGWLFFQQKPESFADHLVVVGDHDPHHTPPPCAVEIRCRWTCAERSSS